MEGMKESGTKHLGIVPISWKVQPFKYCVNICNGREYADIEVEEGGYPVIGSGGEFARASKYCYKGESVLLGRKGTIDRPMYINDAFWCVDTMFYTQTKRNMCAKYLYYCALNFRFDYYMTSTALPSMTQTDLGSEKICVPSIAEQQAIADFLDDKCSQIDGIISDIEKQIDILKSYKKSLITETVTKGLDKNVKMKDSGVEWIGEIPEHWDVKRLGHISDMQNGYVGPTVDILVSEDEGEMYIQSLHVKNGKINFGNDFYVTEKWGKTHPKIYTGDVLVVQTGEIGQIGLVTEEYDGKNCHALIICHTHKEEIVPEYLIYYLMSDVGRWQLLQYETGTTLKHLNSGKIKCSKIIVPKIKEQQVIAEMLKKQCDEVDSIITTKQTQLTQMQQHKKSLIYEYVTGKKRVQCFGD